MNDIERFRQIMNEYKNTANTLCDMLDDYLIATSQKPLQNSSEKEENSNINN